MCSRPESRHNAQQLLAGGAADGSNGASVVHHNDGVSEGCGLQIVGDHDDHLPLVCHPPQRVKDDTRALGIQRACRFVGEDDARASRQSPTQRGPLLFAAGEGPCWRTASMTETERLDQLGDRAAGHLRPIKLEGKRDVLLDGEEGNEIVLLEDESDLGSEHARASARRLAVDVLPVNGDCPRRWFIETAEAHEQRRLSRAGVSHHCRQAATV